MPKKIFTHIERMDRLIRTKSTGTPTTLASKLKVSERCVYNYLNLMKFLGAPIKYCRTRNSYYYDYNGKFNFYFVRENESVGDLMNQ